MADRYLLKSERILLDTKPGLFPEAPVEIPQPYIPYLRLSSYQLHVPQVYALVLPEQKSMAEILLLEQAPFQSVTSSQLADAAVKDSAEVLEVQLLPDLLDVWQSATALRQLNWLWQIAQLWQPLQAEQVTSSLLQPGLLRVEGPLVRLVELQWDQKIAPTLSQLGQFWSQLVGGAKPAIADFLNQLCQQLVQGQVRSAEQLVDLLDQALTICGQSQSSQIHIATCTDQGPSRQRNEDACYPPSGSVASFSLPQSALTIVCDGIGGHQGGDVASNLAIEAVQQRVQQLQLDSLGPTALTVELERAVCVANDLISQRNDDEQRLDRQRMGTTLVMALTRAHELYITHVGDSRAYWITRWGCHQVTVDDDVASREVRLGYTPYREALQQVAAGSLVQALGMGSSATLHPNVQRFVLDEDSVFLLCSDGLSDNDRVEEIWETEILPLLSGKPDLAHVGQRLVEIANTRNGHDNVTVGLVYCQVNAKGEVKVPAELGIGSATGGAIAPPMRTTQGVPQAPVGASPSALKTQLLQPQPQKRSILPLLLGILLLLSLGGLLAYVLFPGVSDRLNPLIGLSPKQPPQTTSTDVETIPSPTEIEPLTVGSFIQVNLSSSGSFSAQREPLVLLPQPQTIQPSPSSSGINQSPNANQPNANQPTETIQGIIPSDSVLQVLNKQRTSEQTSWVRLRVCSVPGVGVPDAGLGTEEDPEQSVDGQPEATPASGSASLSRFIEPGDTGWIQENIVAPLAVQSTTLNTEQQGTCIAPVTSSQPSTPTTEPVPPGG